MIVMDVCSLPRRPWVTRDLVKLSDPDVCLCDHIDVSKETFCEIIGGNYCVTRIAACPFGTTLFKMNKYMNIYK